MDHPTVPQPSSSPEVQFTESSPSTSTFSMLSTPSSRTSDSGSTISKHSSNDWERSDNVVKMLHKRTNKLRKGILRSMQSDIAAASAKLFVAHKLLLKSVQTAQSISADVSSVNAQLLKMNGQCQMLRENSRQALRFFDSGRSGS